MITVKYLALTVLVVGVTGCADGGTMSSIFGPKPVLEEGAPFGAIAFSVATQRWQIESDHPSRLAARNRALSGCQEKDCTVLLEFGRGECASLSLDAAKATTIPYVAASVNAGSAINSARQACSAGGGKDCKAAPPVCN